MQSSSPRQGNLRTSTLTSILYNALPIVLLLPFYSISSQFDQRNFIVEFNPYVAKTDIGVPNGYDDSDLASLLSKVGTKFGRYYLEVYYGHEKYKKPYSVWRFPNVVAKARSNNSKIGDVILNIDVTSGNASVNLLAFDFALNLAEGANNISSQTVTILQLVSSRHSTKADADIIEYSKLKLENSIHSYQLGFSIDTGPCEASLNEFYWKALRQVDVFTVNIPPSEEELGEGPEKFVEGIKLQMSVCRKKFLQEFPKARLQLKSHWPDSYDLEAEKGIHGEDLVKFWRLMNAFAIKTNVTVILSEAFDLAYRNSIEGHRGWWKLVEQRYNHASEYVFEEKGVSVGQKSEVKLVLPVIITIGVVLVMLVLILRVKRQLSNQSSSSLSDSEIREFFDGRVGECCSLIADFHERAYDKNLEIPWDSVKIDMNAVLGSGAFAKVVRATIVRENGTEEVATKMVKSEGSTMMMKGLMSEIKILSYLGFHENVIRLVGAYTAELKTESKLLAFLEFCEIGSLEKYLRDMYSSLNEMNEADLALSQEQAQELLQWSTEIANGMEFLSFKKVVHGDLATRNVLLTSKRFAKISDFGLSRRLYDYANYVKTRQEPLPWRWMAPESLQRLEFTEKSDVWAFGVTLWEIYSLGELPYHGFTWDSGFTACIRNGLRLSKPIGDTTNLYQIMRSCWAWNPKCRPSFNELNLNLQQCSYAVVL